MERTQAVYFLIAIAVFMAFILPTFLAALIKKIFTKEEVEELVRNWKYGKNNRAKGVE